MAAVMSPESQRVAPRTHSAVPRAHCSPVSSQRRRHSSHSATARSSAPDRMQAEASLQ